MLNFNIISDMKNTIFKYLTIIVMFFGLNACDKDFEKINTDPVRQTTIDPMFLFAQAQYGTARNNEFYQLPIVQQVIHPFTGTPSGGNHNVENDAAAGAAFASLFSGPVKYLTDVIAMTKEDPSRTNLYNMARIWRAYVFQVLVDTYGDVPYSQAGLAHYSGINLPEYDSSEDIYKDIFNELDEATKALDGTKRIETNDLFYKGDIDQWKKLGNSLLLRVAMRYTKIDPAKAKLGARRAFDGGVMTSNGDNAGLTFNSTFPNPVVSFVYAEMANIYLGAPFIDYLKNTSDPRLEVIAVKYEFPSNKQDPGLADTDPANQQGFPFGYDDATVSTAPGYPGKIGTAWKYSQINRSTIGRVDAPFFFVTYSQTQLLLAEAAFKGWIPGNAATFYNVGVRANMDQMELYSASAKISSASQDSYLAVNPFDSVKALEQINTQYWISTYLDGPECWANFRRSGFPNLLPNPYPAADPAVKGSFIRRLTYPSREAAVNQDNLKAAIARMGPDNLATRIFWDK